MRTPSVSCRSARWHLRTRSRCRLPQPAADGRRGCDGYAGASSATRGRCHRPGRPRASLPGSPVGLSGTSRVPGLPCGARVRRFCGPLRCFGFPPRSGCPDIDVHTLSPRAVTAHRRHCWRLGGNGRSGPPGSRAIRTLLPGADRCHVKDGCASTSRRRQRHAHIARPQDAGISAAHRRSRHGESHDRHPRSRASGELSGIQPQRCRAHLDSRSALRSAGMTIAPASALWRACSAKSPVARSHRMNLSLDAPDHRQGPPRPARHLLGERPAQLCRVRSAGASASPAR